MPPSVKALGVNAFNHILTALFRNDLVEVADGTVLLVDHSGSIEKHLPEVRLDEATIDAIRNSGVFRYGRPGPV